MTKEFKKLPANVSKRFCKAIEDGRLKIVQEMVEEYNIDVNGVGEEGYPYLAFAAWAPRVSMEGVEYKGTDYEIVAKSGIEIANYLVEKGADIKKARAGKIESRYDAVERFYMKFDLQSSPLLFAIICNNISEVKYLLEAGYDANKDMDENANTALHIAAAEGNVEMVKILLAAGADKDKLNNKGQNALIFAANCPAIYDKSNELNNKHEHGKITENVETDRINRVIAIGTLIDHGANKSGIERSKLFAQSNSIFRNAVFYSNAEGIRSLVNIGADINQAETILSNALKENRGIEFIKVLLEAGADFKKVKIPADHPNKAEVEKLFKEYPARVKLMKQMLGDMIDKEGQLILKPGAEDWEQAMKNKFPKINVENTDKNIFAKGLNKILKEILGVHVPGIVLEYLGKNFDPSKTISESIREAKKNILWNLDPSRSGILKKKQTLDEVLETNPYGKGLKVIEDSDSDEEDRKYPPSVSMHFNNQEADPDLTKALKQSAEEYGKTIKKVVQESRESEQKRQENAVAELPSANVTTSASNPSAKPLESTPQKSK